MTAPSIVDSIWPDGRRGAVSICFDDGRLSQLQLAIPALEARQYRGSFYLATGLLERLPVEMRSHAIEQWRAVSTAGHEIGNHSHSHPCTTNAEHTQAHRSLALENLSLRDIESDIDSAQRALSEALGKTPVTYAYPCGLDFVGAGRERKSYAPLVAEKFLVGRGFNNECPAAPRRCDLAYVPGIPMDRRPAAELTGLVDEVERSGGWLVLVGHNIAPNPADAYTTDLGAFKALLDHLASKKDSIWVDTIEHVGRHLIATREK